MIDPASRSNELFGNSIDLYQNKIVIGIPGRTNDLEVGPVGAVTVFMKSGQVWQQEAILIARDGGQNDLFGHTVTIQQNTLCVSAPRYDHAGYRDLGKAYIYELKDGIWTEASGIIPPVMDYQNHLQFGASLAFFQSHLIISGHLLNMEYEDKGIAYSTELAQSVKTISLSDKNARINIYPNPTSGILRIDLGPDWGGDLHLHLYNLAGTPVMHQEYKSIAKNIELQLGKTTIPPGAYFMYITGNKKTVVHKLVKL